MEQIEFDKLIHYINTHCHSEPATEYLSTFSPSKDKEFIYHRANLINDIQKLLIEYGDFDFRALSDVKTIFAEIKTLAFNFEEFKALIGTVKIGNRLLSSEFRIQTEYILPKYKAYSVERNSAGGQHKCVPTEAGGQHKCVPTEAQRTSALSTNYISFIDPIVAFPALEERFHKIFDEEGNVLDTASSELRNIRKRIRNLKEKIQSELHKTLNDSQINTYLQDKIVTQRNDRFVVPVKEGFINAIEGISHGRSSSGASVYIEPKAVVSLNNEVNDLTIEEKKEIYRIFCEFTKQFRDEESSIIINYDILVKLDTYFACGRVANELQSIVPEIVEENIIELRRARHPLLIIKNKSIKSVIPFNLTLGVDFNVLLISGPNTGGKTVTLKTIGLLTLMALTGLPIPANFGSKIGLLTNIFADIGDNQSIESSLSTFSGHIENIKRIVKNSNENTLVLMDEIGSATDPEQGAALAQAILESLIHKNTLAVITTHYTTLKVFVENTPRCVNASMQFDPEKHEPTYQFVLGFPGNSFAIEIAANLGLDNELIQRAKDLTGTQNIEFTDLLKKMNDEKRRLAENNYQFELKTRLLELRISELETKLKDFEADKKIKMKSSLTVTQDFLTGIQKQINSEIIEIKNLNKEEKKQKLAELDRKVKSYQNDIYEKKTDLEPKFEENQTLQIGDNVYIRTYDTTAVIVGIQKDKFKVEMNGIFYFVRKNDLQKIKPTKVQSSSQGVGEVNVYNQPISIISTQNIDYNSKIKMEINLLGKTFEEALPLIDELLDNALYSGLSRVRIVHGRGTGILRQKIRNYLKKHDKVQDFFSPAHDAGGDGVTVVVI